jgi:p-hydroxybenzoate 3-monooxygenase
MVTAQMTTRAVARTQVGIVGAGPAGLLLSHLLHLAGVEAVVLENRSREYVQQRVRAGVLEQGTADLLAETGVGERLAREGIVHHGLELRFEGAAHRIPLSELADGRTIVIYGQQRVVEDLTEARLAAGGRIHFEVADVSVHDIDSTEPKIRYTLDGEPRELACDFIAGCDGFHGVCRPSIPAGALSVFDHVYPYGWLGILATVPPSTEELIYCYHDRGFALHSLRSPELSRLYIQVDPDEDIADWSDGRIWEELHTRFATHDGWSLKEGPIVDKAITAMRSFVVEPMQHGRLFLAGDAAHIVPPTGAKGMNLAIADVKVLAEALEAKYASNNDELLNSYSETCLRRVWRAEHFSWWMTSMLHRFPDDVNGFQHKIQISQLRYTVNSKAAATSLAENYVGLESV